MREGVSNNAIITVLAGTEIEDKNYKYVSGCLDVHGLPDRKIFTWSYGCCTQIASASSLSHPPTVQPFHLGTSHFFHLPRTFLDFNFSFKAENSTTLFTCCCFVECQVHFLL